VVLVEREGYGTVKVSRVRLALAVLAFAVLLIAGCGGSAISGSSPWQSVRDPDLSILAFTDSAHGWAIGPPGVMATSDAGRHWQASNGRIVGAPATGPAALPTTIDQLSQPTGVVCAGHDVLVTYGGEAFGLTAGRSGILASSDGGASWRPRLSFASAQDTVISVAAVDQTHLWALCSTGPLGGQIGQGTGRQSTFLLRTSDGGAHWVRLPVDDIGDAGLGVPTPLVFTGAEHGWSFWQELWQGGQGAAAPLLRTTADGGRNWTKTAQPNLSLGFCALDARHAWSTTGTLNQRSQFIGLVATSDDGRTWVPDHAFEHVQLAAVYFANFRHGWVVAAGAGGSPDVNGVYATSDRGRHWARELIPSQGSSAAWRRSAYPQEWRFCPAGDRLIVYGPGGMFSRPLPAASD
jgi:photosystem II stability/assembly factor-like uncharacterized protein